MSCLFCGCKETYPDIGRDWETALNDEGYKVCANCSESFPEEVEDDDEE